MPVTLNIVESVNELDVLVSQVVIESASTPGPSGADGADGEGVPVGGTDGQVLTKASATDFDTAWEDPTGGGSGVVETIVAGSNVDVDATDPANPVVSMEVLEDADIPATIARDAEVTAAVAAEAALARNADNLTSGTVADARIPATITRDAEAAAAYQPLDADLTALAGAGNSAVLAATTASFLTADETKLDGIEVGATADQSAAEVPFTPAGTIAATDVQAAIEEVAAEAGGGGGTVDTVVAGSNIDVDATDPANPVVSVEALTSADVGLGNVDNTSDAGKPVSTAQQTALDLKAPLASPALTGTPTVPTAAQGTNTTQAASTAYVQTEAGLLVPKSLLTTDGDLLTRAAGVPARITRASLAADTAFSSVYAPIAYGTFFRKVRATLTDKTSFAGTTAEQWGTEEAVLDDALLPALTSVTVDARVFGTAFNLSTNSSSLLVAVEISLDGGATWSTGIDTQMRRSGDGVAGDRFPIAAEHSTTGTVSGDIQARAMATCPAGAGAAYDVIAGALYMDVIRAAA